MTSKKRLTLICYAATFLEFLAILLWGVSGYITGNELGYVVLNFFMIMPITSFIAALLLSLTKAALKWFYPVVFGIFSYMIPMIVFGSFEGILPLFSAFVPAVLGLGLGLLIAKLRSMRHAHLFDS